MRPRPIFINKHNKLIFLNSDDFESHILKLFARKNKKTISDFSLTILVSDCKRKFPELKYTRDEIHKLAIKVLEENI